MSNADLSIIQIPPSDLSSVWHLCTEMLQGCCERSSGDFTLGNVSELIESGAWQLWFVWGKDSKTPQAIATTEIHAMPSGQRVANVVFCTGVRRHEWMHLIDDLEAWAGEQGCQKFRMWARKGWARNLPDYKITHVMLEREVSQ